MEREEKMEQRKWEAQERERDCVLEMETLKHAEHEQEQACELERIRLKLSAEGGAVWVSLAANGLLIGGRIKAVPPLKLGLSSAALAFRY
ncbi:hypothetical protein N1851_010613 [Merluccius polli]|uniref:Uncharacterized protein n=1 Tax=Merluccius polli TaxID=89951 RepID=A0AA47MZN2_MERPO|nr:hypothetical protein N1851_010613 [Merluccius polli]